MKRSKIVSLIADYFYECNVDAPESEELAEKVLSKLERNGAVFSYYDLHCGEYFPAKEIQVYCEEDARFEWQPEKRDDE